MKSKCAFLNRNGGVVLLGINDDKTVNNSYLCAGFFSGTSLQGEVIQSAIPHYKVDALLRRVDLDRYDDRENMNAYPTSLVIYNDRVETKNANNGAFKTGGYWLTKGNRHN